jgi:hypothetical protein
MFGATAGRVTVFQTHEAGEGTMQAIAGQTPRVREHPELVHWAFNAARSVVSFTYTLHPGHAIDVSASCLHCIPAPIVQALAAVSAVA